MVAPDPARGAPVTFPPMFRDDDDDDYSAVGWPPSPPMDPATAEDVATFMDQLVAKRSEARERHLLASAVEPPQFPDAVASMVRRMTAEVAEQKERLARAAYFLTDDDRRDRLHFIETDPRVDRSLDARRNVESWTWTQDVYPACWIVRPT